MKVARTILRTGFVGLASLVGLAFCGLVAAQAPAGPVPAPPPGAVPAAKAPEPRPLPAARQSILGDWVLNRDESDDPRRHMRDDEDSNGGYGGRRPGGWPGGGGGRRGGYGGESDSERQKMHELLSPPTNITLSMTGAEVDLKDDHDRDRKSTRLNSSHVEISYAVFCLKKKKKTDNEHVSPN